MKLQILPLMGFLIISSTALAGSDTVTCKSKSGAVAFDVGNGSNTISIKMKNKKSGKISTLTAPLKLMPNYDYNTEETDKTMSALPVSEPKMLGSHNQTQVIYDKNGKLKCSGRELIDETYSQSVLITAKSYGRENQGLDYKLIEENSIPGLLKDSGYVKADVICHHEMTSTAGGCFADEGDIVKIEPSKF